jgi:hypothetical protein
MLNENQLTFERLITTTDLFRVDDRNEGRCLSSQKKVGEWIHTLLAPVVSNSLGLSPSNVSVLHGDEGGYESIRWKIFSKAMLPLHYDSWAMLYEGEGYESLFDEELLPSFSNAVVLSFEACPAMLAFFDRNSIPYVDCSIHPIRFLPDYYLGFRTNVQEWLLRLKQVRVPDDLIRDFARVSAGRTVMNFPPAMFESLEEGSAIFFGQMDIDASLIHQGRMANEEQIEAALIELSAAYPRVYYKRHPHNGNAKSLEKVVSKIKGCEWLEINAYDSMALPHFDLFATLSSGTSYEAKYFGKKTKCFLREKSWFDIEREEQSLAYYGVYESYFGQPFWNFLLAGESDGFSPSLPNAFEGGMKFNLNKKWGR